MGRCWERHGKTKGKSWEKLGDRGQNWEWSGKDPGVMWAYFGNTMGTFMGTLQTPGLNVLQWDGMSYSDNVGTIRDLHGIWKGSTWDTARILKGVVWERDNVSNLAASIEAAPHQSSLGSDHMNKGSQQIQPSPWDPLGPLGAPWGPFIPKVLRGWVPKPC